MKWSMILLGILAVCAAILAFTTLVSAVADIAKIVFYVAVALFAMVGAGVYWAKQKIIRG